jgi:hypothetical protein
MTDTDISPRPSVQCLQVFSTVRLIHQQSTVVRRYIQRMNPFDADVTKAKEYARLETATLKDVTDDYYYGCACQFCQHTVRLNLSRLRDLLGPDFPLRKIRERLKCDKCSGRKVTVTFLSPNQKGGNLHVLFDKDPC